GLAERRVGDDGGAGEVGRVEQPPGGGRSIDAGGAAGDLLAEEVEPGDIAELVGAVGGDPEFLAVLVLARGDALGELDRDAGVVAVVGDVPVPVAPGRDGGERDRACVVVDDAGDAAVLRVDAQIGVDV